MASYKNETKLPVLPISYTLSLVFITDPGRQTILLLGQLPLACHPRLSLSFSIFCAHPFGTMCSTTSLSPPPLCSLLSCESRFPTSSTFLTLCFPYHISPSLEIAFIRPEVGIHHAGRPRPAWDSPAAEAFYSSFAGSFCFPPLSQPSLSDLRPDCVRCG